MNEGAAKNGRGRPKGSKNKETKSKESPTSKTPPTPRSTSKERNKDSNGSKKTTKVVGSQTEPFNPKKSVGFENYPENSSVWIEEPSSSGKQNYVINDEENDEDDEPQSSIARSRGKDTRKRNSLQGRLSDSLEQLLESHDNSDVDVIVDEHIFPVHKAILNARCPMLMEMLDTKESTIHIGDIDKDVLKEFLRFIYSGKTKGIEDIASQLLEVADRFNVEDLKNMCVKYMTANLSVENVINILSISVNFKAKKLRSKAIKFIESNLDEVINYNWDCFQSKSSVRNLLFALLPQKK